MKKVISITVLLASIAVYLIILRFSNSQRDFEQGLWMRSSDKKSASANDNPRGLMIRDLIENKIKKGVSLNYLEQLLGPPDETAPDEYLYYTGNRHGSLISGRDYLVLKFDKNQTLRAAEIRICR